MNSKLKEEIKREHFRVAIFGSARTKPDDEIYKKVYTLAKMAAKESYDIVTGGGPGLMDAASRGHYDGRKKNDVHTIGLAIKLPREQSDSYHLDVREQFNTFSKRLDHFMKLSNAVVVCPGGVGTALEFFYTWQLIQVKHVCQIPIILLGNMWQGLIDWIIQNQLKNKLLSEVDMDYIFLVDTPKEAMKILKKTNEIYEQGGKDICNNVNFYKVK